MSYVPRTKLIMWQVSGDALRICKLSELMFSSNGGASLCRRETMLPKEKERVHGPT